MTTHPNPAVRVLIVPGSARRGSLNLQLARAAAALLRDDGAEVTLTDLRALALPVYDGDLEAEQGVPAGARTGTQGPRRWRPSARPSGGIGPPAAGARARSGSPSWPRTASRSGSSGGR